MDENPNVAHEAHDVSARAIVRAGIALVFAAAVIHVGIWLLFRLFETRAERRDVPRTVLGQRRPVEAPRSPERLFPEPRLERFPFAGREALRREEDARLGSYAWEDRGAGVVRIPIARAMQLIAERGIPPTAAGAPVPPPSVAAPAPAASRAPTGTRAP